MMENVLSIPLSLLHLLSNLALCFLSCSGDVPAAGWGQEVSPGVIGCKGAAADKPSSKPLVRMEARILYLEIHLGLSPSCLKWN